MAAGFRVFPWVAPSTNPAPAGQVQKRLAKYGMRRSEIEQLFDGEEKKGEGIVRVPIGLERLHEDGVWSAE